MSTGRQVAKARACKARIAGSTPARCSSYALLAVIAIHNNVVPADLGRVFVS
jgi:hypothetical protein